MPRLARPRDAWQKPCDIGLPYLATRRIATRCPADERRARPCPAGTLDWVAVDRSAPQSAATRCIARRRSENLVTLDCFALPGSAPRGYASRRPAKPGLTVRSDAAPRRKPLGDIGLGCLAQPHSTAQWRAWPCLENLVTIAALRLAVPGPARPCRGMPRHAAPRAARGRLKPCDIGLPRFGAPRHALPCRTVPRPAKPYRA